MAYDYEFTDGFDNLGPVGRTIPLTDLFGDGGWTSPTGGAAYTVISPLVGTGSAIQIAPVGGAPANLSKTLPDNYARSIGGFTTAPDLRSSGGVAFGDGAADQLTILINTSGRVEVRRGNHTGLVLATSAEVFADGVASVLEWDVTFHQTAGKVKIWKDGRPTSIDLSGVDTCATVNEYHNAVRLALVGVFAQYFPKFDHFYNRAFLSAGSADTPCLDNPVIETQFPVADISTMFAGAAGILGSANRVVPSSTAPGANRLTLRRYTPEVGCTLNSVSIVPAAASGTAKFKAALYADSAGAPGARLDGGTEVVGCTANATLTLPLTAPKALTGGVAYWIGYITDASVTLQHETAGTQAYGAANTYTTGAPATAPAMTAGLASWLIWGNCTLFAKNYAVVSANPSAGALAYASGASVGDKDMFAFPPLVSTPQTIHTTAIKGRISKSDGGARTVNLKQKSAAAESNGSAAGQSPTASESTLASYSRTDPNTGTPWTPAAVNSATGGYEIAS